jgi:hypothetical protein
MTIKSYEGIAFTKVTQINQKEPSIRKTTRNVDFIL